MDITTKKILCREACKAILHAIDLYQEEKFKEANLAVKNYIKKYGENARGKILEHKSDSYNAILSFIVVTTGSTQDKLQKCLLSILHQNHLSINLIVILNGCEANNAILSTLNEPRFSMHNIEIYKIPINIFPSEARNLGAYAASGKWIIFIDDDGLISNNYTKSLMQLIATNNFLGCRGKVVPICKDINPPEHYDLGETIKSCELNTEGNFVISKNLFLLIGGFNPIMYAHEGKNLHARCLEIVNKSYFLYSPSLVLNHNPSQGSKLHAKMQRNKLATAYLMKIGFTEAPHTTAANILIVIMAESSKRNLATILHDLAQKNESPFKFDIIVLTNDYSSTLNIATTYRPLLNIKVLNSCQTALSYIQKKSNFIGIVLTHAREFTHEALMAIMPKLLRNEIGILKDSSTSEIGLCAYIPSTTESTSNTSLEKIKSYISSNTESLKPKILMHKKSIIFASFYTPDKYYTLKAQELTSRLDALGIDHFIKKIEIPKGLKWPAICRKKVQYIHDAFETYKDEYQKIGWIDVDCCLERLPDFLLDFDVDIIGFARGFQHSEHRKQVLTRYWEPCFFVFNTNTKCREFLKTAAKLENQAVNIEATDDYFFEEAWRKHNKILTHFCIPGEYSNRKRNTVFLKSQYRANGIFFEFGESGKVQEFKGKVKQHRPEERQSITSESDIQGIKPSANPLGDLMKIIASDKQALMRPENTILDGINEITRDQVKSLVSYKDQEYYIPLFWWIRPAPGNMGDWLSPYLINKLTGHSVEYNNMKKAKIISLGSIGRYIESHHTVWGTGISTTNTDLNPHANYLAVRGPYTSRALSQSGGPKIEVFGDPGILIKNIYSPQKLCDSPYTYGFVRHFIHQDIPLTFDEEIEDLNILLSSSSNIENFISRLASYKAVLTTSLHVMILCHAYRVPCRLVNLESEIRPVHGDGIKYRDFYEGAGLKYIPHATLGDHIYSRDFDLLVSDEFVPESYGEELSKVLTRELCKNPDAFVCRKSNKLHLTFETI